MELDWTTPPAPKEFVNVWEAFHDAEVVQIQSDPLARTLDLTIDLGFPAPPFPFPSRVRLKFQEVSFALVFGWRRWSGPWGEQSSDPVEREAQIAAFHQKGRVETISLKEIAEFVTGRSKSEILQAEYGCEPGKVWFNASCVSMGEYDSWDIKVFGSGVEITDENDQTVTMEQLLEIGRAGWDHWAKKTP